MLNEIIKSKNIVGVIERNALDLETNILVFGEIGHGVSTITHALLSLRGTKEYVDANLNGVKPEWEKMIAPLYHFERSILCNVKTNDYSEAIRSFKNGLILNESIRHNPLLVIGVQDKEVVFCICLAQFPEQINLAQFN